MDEKDYIRNPYTGRSIRVGGKTYKKIMLNLPYHVNSLADEPMENCSQSDAVVTGAVVGGVGGLAIGGIAGGGGGALVGGLGGAALGAGIGYVASRDAKEQCLKRNHERELARAQAQKK